MDVARAAGVSLGLVSALENARLGGVSVAAVRKVAAVLDIEIDVRARWHGGELDSLINARHNLLAEAVAKHLTALGWSVEAEVSFSYFGERGVIDLFAWHPPTATVLVVEVKTEIVDPQELLGTFHKKRRLARRIARDRGLRPQVVGAWLVVAEGSTNRKRVARFGTMLRGSLPADTKSMATWLSSPAGAIAGISFFANFNQDVRKAGFASRKRVRLKKSTSPEHEIDRSPREGEASES
jgi:transcriptional regulator with XRE-family HTH domain